MQDRNAKELKVLLDCKETLFNQFVMARRLEEIASNTLFTAQNTVLMLFKQANKALTVVDMFQAVLLMDSASKDTFFNQAIVLTRDDETVLTEPFVIQSLLLRFK